MYSTLKRTSSISRNDQDVDGKFYVGIIAEEPKSLNKNRYLIFFDDGYAQYTDPSEVLPVVETPDQVWREVHQESREFIKHYLMRFPERLLLRVDVGATFNVERNGEWIPARVLEIDEVLFKVEYIWKEKNKKKKAAETAVAVAEGKVQEWIYRGSSRLAPLLAKMREEKQSIFTTTVARRRTFRKPTIEVNNANEDDEAYQNLRDRRQKQGKNDALDISALPESRGNIKTIEISLDCPTPKPFVSHSCSPSCAYPFEEDTFKKVSPLAIPLHLGWTREFSAGPNNTDRVSYVTPCGVRCESYEAIHFYIEKTEVMIPIDFFSIKVGINCLSEFEPLEVKQYLEDMSRGKESIPISCVNALDDELPEEEDFEYVTERKLGEGVEIDDDSGFLFCCDCVDDCQDKEKCACQRETMAGPSFTIARQEGKVLRGYENRRLNELVVSGIYECNRNCKCRSTCFNRVAQNKVRWPVQMFKTAEKGWGIRALNDIAKGSYVCAYIGKVLTDMGANEAGTEVNDEYLADLDYIEINEKDGYESDVTDIENDEEAEETDRKGRREVARKSTVFTPRKSTGTGKKRTLVQDDDDGERPSTSAQARQINRKCGFLNLPPPKARESTPPISSISVIPSTSTSSSSFPQVSSPVSTEVIFGLDNDTDDDDDADGDDDDAATIVCSSFPAMPEKPRLKLRKYFGEDEAIYAMDPKSMGNFGRYLNHSCDPNVFVQNLFVDTHDIRFPWIAFFTKEDVKAGTELTWDYNYVKGSVPGRTLYCKCLSENCRVRLL